MQHSNSTQSLFKTNKKVDISPVQNLKILSEDFFICVEATDFEFP